jgi:hypothetical protein
MRTRQFYIATLLLASIVIFSFGTGLGWWNLNFVVGPYYLHHWLSITSATYIAIFIPIYAITKRRNPKRMKTLLSVHVYGYLVAFLPVSVHFAYHITSPRAFGYGTGLALYTTLALMVLTGYTRRFQFFKQFASSWKFIHVSLALAFYIIVVFHGLRNFGIIRG